MKLSQGAYGMLVQRYCAVLKKCRLFNVLGSAVVAGSVVLGNADLALALTENFGENLFINGAEEFSDKNYSGNVHSLYYSSMIVDKGTVTVVGGGTRDVDLSMSGNVDRREKPFVDSSFGPITVKNGGTLQIIGDERGKSIGARVNAGNVTINGGTLESSSNFHVGTIKDNQSNPNHGFRVHSLNINGGTITIKSKLGIFSDGVINLNDGILDVAELEAERSEGTLIVGKKGILQVKNQFSMGQKFKLKVEPGGQVIPGGSDKMLIAISGTENEITGSVQGKVDLDVKEGSSLTLQGGTVDVESLYGKGSVAVGTAGQSGVLVGGNVTMPGGQIAFDPEFAVAGDTSNASLGGLQFTSDSVDAKVIAGQNSMVSLGSKDVEWLRDKVTKYQNDGKGTWGQDVTAALALRTPQTLASTGALKVDGAWKHGEPTLSAGTAAQFAANSLLVVDAAGVGNKVALTGSRTGKLDVAGEAKLLIAGGQEGQTVKITDGFSDESIKKGTGWTGVNLATNTALLDAEAGTFDPKTGAYSVTLKKGATAESAFADMSGEMQSLVSAMVVQKGVDANSPNAGVRFVSRALSDDRIGRSNPRLAVSTLEGAAQLAAVGAVQATTLGAANAGAAAVAARTSLALPNRDSSRLQAVQLDSEGKVEPSGLSAGDETSALKNGLGLWIMPLYQADNVWGMKSGEFKGGWNSSLGGLALGADWTFDSMFRIGATFNIGGGYAKSSGDFASTDNRFNFWGVGIYGAWSQGGFGLTADAGYTANASSLDQDLPAAMGMPRLEADVTSHAWHAGLKAEYRFSFGDFDVIPHVGVRYMNVATDKYDVESGGGTVFEVGRATQDIWTFPLGVQFAYGMTSDNGWTFTPRLDVGVVPAAGDVHARSRTRLPGVNGQADMKMQVVDYVTFDGGLGFDLSKDSFSLGVNYNLQASEHRTGHSVSATLRYEF